MTAYILKGDGLPSRTRHRNGHKKGDTRPDAGQSVDVPHLPAQLAADSRTSLSRSSSGRSRRLVARLASLARRESREFATETATSPAYLIARVGLAYCAANLVVLVGLMLVALAGCARPSTLVGGPPREFLGTVRCTPDHDVLWTQRPSGDFMVACVARGGR